jgi:ketosteroid isomerase-like protein
MAEPDPSLLELLRRHTEAWNRHDLDALMALFAEDCVFEASGGDEVCGKRYKGYREVKEALPRFSKRCPTPSGATDAISVSRPTMEYPSGPSPAPCPMDDALRSTAATS